MIRLFVALALPEAARERLTLLAGGVPGAKWSKPEQYHVTLRFIGEVDGAVSSDIADALATIEAPPFDLELAGAGSWGEKRRTNQLWIGVKPSEPLLRLQKKIESALVRVGIEPEHRKFHPHVTIARLNFSQDARVADFLARHGDFSYPAFPVREFVLYSSFLSHSGAIYRPEATYPLGDASQVEPAWLSGGE